MSHIALIHPTGLVGSTLRESLGLRSDLWTDVMLLSTQEEEIGTLTEVRRSAAMVQAFEAESLAAVDVAFFCGPMAHNRPLLTALPAGASAVILAPDATLEDGHPVVAGINLETAERGIRLLSPHPGTVALAHLIAPLVPFAPRRAVVTLLQPTSAVGAEALEEVLDQTRSILAFQPSPEHEVFPTQLAFNLFPAADQATQLPAQLGRLLAYEMEVAVQVLQVSAFHSFGISLHLELDDDPGPDSVRHALAGHPFNEMADEPDQLGLINAAASDNVLVGAVQAEPSGGYWIWAVMDNLTCGGALNALHILETLNQNAVN